MVSFRGVEIKNEDAEPKTRNLLFRTVLSLDSCKSARLFADRRDVGPYNRAFKHRLGYELRNIAYLIIVCANRRDRRPGGP